MSIWKKHEVFEKHSLVLVIGILVVVAIGGLVEIAPLFYLKSTIEKVEGMRPYTPLELAGRNVYIREGCYLCHSQMVRPMRDELERVRVLSRMAEALYGRGAYERCVEVCNGVLERGDEIVERDHEHDIAIWNPVHDDFLVQRSRFFRRYPAQSL